MAREATLDVTESSAATDETDIEFMLALVLFAALLTLAADSLVEACETLTDKRDAMELAVCAVDNAVDTCTVLLACFRLPLTSSPAQPEFCS